MSRATYDDWKEAVQLHKRFCEEADAGRARIRYPRCNPKEKLYVLSFFDASLGKEKDGKSQLGALHFVTTEAVKLRPTPASAVEWNSNRSGRVIRSSMAAEAASMSGTVDKRLFNRLVLDRLMRGERELDPDDYHACGWWLVTDARSLYGHLHSAQLPTERQTMLDLLVAKDQLERSPCQRTARPYMATPARLPVHIPAKRILPCWLLYIGHRFGLGRPRRRSLPLGVADPFLAAPPLWSTKLSPMLLRLALRLCLLQAQQGLPQVSLPQDVALALRDTSTQLGPSSSAAKDRARAFTLEPRRFLCFPQCEVLQGFLVRSRSRRRHAICSIAMSFRNLSKSWPGWLRDPEEGHHVGQSLCHRVSQVPAVW